MCMDKPFFKQTFSNFPQDSYLTCTWCLCILTQTTVDGCLALEGFPSVVGQPNQVMWSNKLEKIDGVHESTLLECNHTM